MRSGQLRHRCVLMQAQTITRPGGGITESWVELGKRWAEISIPTGRLAPMADRLEATVTAEIKIRYRSDVIAGMRLTCSRGTYLVEAVLPDRDPAMLRLLCSSVTNP